MSTMKNPTKVITDEVRFSYVRIDKPNSVNGGTPKYSLSVIIRKDDTKTLNLVNAAVDAAIKEGAAKFGGKIPSKANLRLPLKDGDDRDDEAYHGCYYINANSTTPPQVVDRNLQRIFDLSEVYSGCYGRVSLNMYAFNANGNKGIACGLNNIQKLRDGEPLGGKSSAEADFAVAVDTEDDDLLA